MKKSTILSHIENSSSYSEIDSILYKICFYGAPTVNRVKPASLICFKNSESDKLKDMWDKYKDIVKDMVSFKFKEVRRWDEGVNVLFYWDEWLDRIVKSSKVSAYLNNIGYNAEDGVDKSLDILSSHFSNGCPHEIGIFLGYPLSDVIEFSSSKSKECICVGYWKVYSNMTRAKKIFDLYDKSRTHVINCLKSGLNPQQLLNLCSTQRMCA